MKLNKRVQTMSLPITDIVVGERIRKENGAIDELAESIRERGLINPITAMELTGGGYQLIAGLRRLEAVKMLGLAEIRATVLTPMEADEALMTEIAENEQRKEFTLAERLEYADRIRVVEKEKAKERMAVFAREGRNEGTAKRPYPEKGETRDIVAKKAGFTSQQQMRRAAVVAKKSPELLDMIDTGKASIYGAYKTATGNDKPAFTPDSSLENAPVMPGHKMHRRAAKGDRETIQQISDRIVTAKEVEVESLARFNPASVNTDGDPDTVAGANHERLSDNPVYSALYEHYQEAVSTANVLTGELRSRCESYEKRIRAYEENRQTMTRTIEELRAECAALRAQIEGATPDA